MLSLETGFPTGHITWASRGWGAAEAEELAEQGFDPMSAPGPCEGQPYSAAFRRKAAGVFAVKGAAGTGDPHWRDEVFRAVCHLGRRDERWRGLFTSGGGTVSLLDGKLSWYSADYGFSGLPTMDLYGNRALRLVCGRLGLRQPRRFPDEDRVPTLAELEADLLEQLNRPPEKPPPTPPTSPSARGVFAQQKAPTPAAPPPPPAPTLSRSGMAFVDGLLAIRSGSDFIIAVQEYEGSDSIEALIRYLDVNHPDLAEMVSGAVDWNQRRWS